MKKLLFISNREASFLTIAIRANLQADNYKVMFSGFDMNEISRMEKRPDLILLHFENIEEKDKQFLFYIGDLSIEEEKRLYLCGYADDVENVASVLPKGAVMGTFVRPFNMAELVARMNKEVDRYVQEGGKKHILVVDDSGEMLRAIKAWLSDTYRITIVNSGANAILFLANHKPDLILLDYEMPLCSGPQMMEMLRAESSTSSIPIMFLTGKSDRESVKKVLLLKPEGYMLKTMKPDEIKEAINNFFIAQKSKRI